MAFNALRYLLFLALGLGGLVALVTLWLAWVRWQWRLRGSPACVLTARCADGWELALHHRPAAERRFVEPVLLCHGLSVNHTFMDFEPPNSLAQYLAQAGFDCFALDLRGTGGSKRPPPGKRRFDFAADDHLRLDGPAAIARVLELTGAPRLFLVGHSLGGMVSLCAAARVPAEQVAGLVIMASPVFFRLRPGTRAAVGLGRFIGWPFGLRYELVSQLLAPLAGWFVVPRADTFINLRRVSPRRQRLAMVNAVSSVGYRLLAQLVQWALTDTFRSADGLEDYRSALTTVNRPVLVLGGSADHLAPPAALQALRDAIASSDKSLLVVGEEPAEARGYGHGDLTLGDQAPDEVFPHVRDWLHARATPREASSAEAGRVGTRG